MRLVLAGGLDPVDMVIARQMIGGLASVTGADADIERKARERLLKEQADAIRNQPVFTQQLGDDNIGTYSNPLAPGTPRP